MNSQTEKWLAILKETTALLDALKNKLGDDALELAPEDGEWSAKDILGHLLSCQDVWAYTIYAMRLLSEPSLEHIHPREWAKVLKYEVPSFSETLAAFTSRREDLLRILGNLSAEDWARSATIKGREHSIFSQIRRMAKHEEDHWPQLVPYLE